MGNFSGKFDSAKQDWTTPDEMFDRLNIEFDFEIDLAASESNSKCKVFFDESNDAMDQEWDKTGWLNPPYGATGKYKLSAWIKKAYEQANKHDTCIVVLTPARTNTGWWHKYCMRAREIKFLEGRPKFGNATHGLPQPLALIVFARSDELKISSFKIRN